MIFQKFKQQCQAIVIKDFVALIDSKAYAKAQLKEKIILTGNSIENLSGTDRSTGLIFYFCNTYTHTSRGVKIHFGFVT